MFGKERRVCTQCGSTKFNRKHPTGQLRCSTCGAFAWGLLGQPWGNPPPKRRVKIDPKFGLALVIAVSVGALGGLWLYPVAPGTNTECNIKGNISFSGERIYHVPGGEYYDKTVIRPEYGERWFCSEAEARAAGWRKSKR